MCDANRVRYAGASMGRVRHRPGLCQITAKITRRERRPVSCDGWFARVQFVVMAAWGNVMKKQTAAGSGLRALVKQLKAHRDAIAKERDALRTILEDIESLLDPTDRGVEALDEAVESLSEQA